VKTVLSFLLFLSAVTALAQTSADIVVTASAVPETIETTPAAVTVVTRKQIEERASVDLADVLREVPGLAFSRTGSAGRATSLFTRGANSTHTLVLWNGIQLNNPYFSGFDWGQFSTAGVEQVEVVRGPYSALYGSDAVAGVVNVLTSPTSNTFTGNIEGGSHGLRNAQVAGAYAGGSAKASGAWGRREDEGFADNDDIRQNNANVYLQWTPGANFWIGASARRNSYDLGIPVNTNAAGTELIASPNRRGSGSDRQFAIPITQSIGRFSYDVALSDNRRRDDFADPDDPYGLTEARTESKTRRARLVTRTSTSFGTIVAGGEYARAIVDDANTYGVNLAGNRRTERSFFLEDRISHETASGAHLELSLGARRDNFDTFGSETSPRVAVAFVRGGSKLRAAYGQAFRAPSVGELYFPFSGNAALEAEHSSSFEVGFDRGLGTDALVSVTYFNSSYRDLIIFEPSTFVFANIGRAKSDGIEAGFERRIANQFYTSLSYTWLHKDEDESTGKRLLRRPEHSGSLAFGYTRGAINTNVAVIRSGARGDILPVAPYSRVENRGYTTIDINMQYRMSRFAPYVKIENVRDTRYEEVMGYPSPGRRTIIGLRFGS
jgi:vitamin B12 transporter